MSSLSHLMDQWLAWLSMENRLAFAPRRSRPGQTPPPPGVEDVIFLTADGVQIRAWWLPPSFSELVILLCHGNAGCVADRAQEMVTYQRELDGAGVLLFDYPGFGQSGGRATERGCYASAWAAWEWLNKQQQIDPQRLIVVGESLGGAVATYLSTNVEPRLTVLVRTFNSLPEMGRELYGNWRLDRWMWMRFDNLSRMLTLKGPIFIAHGLADELVPFRMSEQLFAVAADPKQFMPLEGIDHDDPMPEAFFTNVRNWLRETAMASNPGV